MPSPSPADVLLDYTRWARDVASRDVDTTPEAYLAHRKVQRARAVIEDCHESAGIAAAGLRDALEHDDVSPELRVVLEVALGVCHRVEEAEHWA